MTYTASPYPGYATETVTYYRGTCKVYSPVTQAEEDAHGNFCTCPSEYVHMHARPIDSDCRSMAGGSHEEHVTCTHRHTDPAKAKACGGRLAARTCREWNRAGR
jgi:hypothetical protein